VKRDKSKKKEEEIKNKSTPRSTINTMQDQYACIEGLTRMHMEHAMPICGGIMHL
jgi:hypothetical protein